MTAEQILHYATFAHGMTDNGPLAEPDTQRNVACLVRSGAIVRRLRTIWLGARDCFGGALSSGWVTLVTLHRADAMFVSVDDVLPSVANGNEKDEARRG